MQKITDNLIRGNISQEGEHNWYHFYRAKVIDAHDEKKMGRVKLWIPDIMPEPPPEGPNPCLQGIWAHPANNYLGGRNLPDMMGSICEFTEGHYQGSCLIPPKGSWVWIFFENGDPNYPCYFAAADNGARMVLPENQLGPEWEKKWTLIKTRMGRCIVFSDDPFDERVEITGKKRMINDPPDGDTASVKQIVGNMTTLLLDERDGFEKYMIKDYRGNHITLHTNDEGVLDQLHIFMASNIEIESGKDIKIKAAGDIHIEAGNDYKLHSIGSTHIKSDVNIHESSMENTYRHTMGCDVRESIGHMSDKSVGKMTRSAVGDISETGAGKIFKAAMGNIEKYSQALVRSKAALSHEIFSKAATNILGASTMNLNSDGPINMQGSRSNIQSGVMPAIPAPPWLVTILAVLSGTAIPATPFGDRIQEIINIIKSLPPIPAISPPPLPTIVLPIPEGDAYDEVERATPPRPFIDTEILDFPPTLPPIVTSSAPSTTPTPVVKKLMGIGHIFSISLKDDYRDMVIPLAKASGATHVGFHLLRDLNPGADNIYLDDISVWNNYRNPGTTSLNWEDWNLAWWGRFADFLAQAKSENIVVVPTLFDFCCSPYDPFLTHIKEMPYTTNSWKSEAQESYVSSVVDFLNGSGVDYIINLGSKSYNMNQQQNRDLLPSPGYIRKLILFLVETLGVPLKKISLTANSNRDLYSMNPVVYYQMYTGVKVPKERQINNEEYVDGQWGGLGRVYVYDSDGKLIDGYVKYLTDTENGIPCMSTWKMSHFDDGSHDMNVMFAPKQREAMRIVQGISGNGDV